MKKYFFHILSIILIISFFGVFDISSAQQGTTTPVDVSSSDCDIFSNLGACATNWISNALASLLYTILTIASMLLYIAGMFLDFVLNFTITNMKVNLFGDGTPANPGLIGINKAWKVIKDLMNISFIFILLYQGIKMILGQENQESVKNFIVGVILASLLINFSLFFTKVLIDASNLVTLSFYRAVLNSSPGINIGTYTINGISVPFMQKLGLTSFWSNASFDQIRLVSGGNQAMIIIPLMGTILFLIVSFVFFAVALMFALRYMALIILLVLSPIAYMGMALPFMKKYADEWWTSLNSQLLFAPIYMAMTWVVLILIGTSGFVVQGDWGAIISGNPTVTNPNGTQQSSISLIFNFIIIIGFIIASLVISRQTAKKGSKYIGEYTGKLSSFAGGAVMGGVGRFGRATIGRAGYIASNDKSLQDRAATQTGIKGAWARANLALANRAANASFDVRATDSFGKLTEATGFKGDFGKVDVKKENFKSILEQKRKEAAEKVKLYKPSDSTYADAKDKDKKSKDAENVLNSNEFKTLENNRWLETDQGKDFSQKQNDYNKSLSNIEENNKKIEENKIKLKSLQKTLDWTESQEEKNKLQNEINDINDDNSRRKTEIDDINKTLEERKRLLEEARSKRDQFKSQEKSDLEELVSLGKDNESNLNKTYKDRVEAYAKRVEKGGVMYRYGQTLSKIMAGTIVGAGLGGLPGAVIGGGYYLSQAEQTENKSERQMIARGIRSTIQEKSKKQKAEEATREWMEEQQKEQEKDKQPEPKPEEKKGEPKTT